MRTASPAQGFQKGPGLVTNTCVFLDQLLLLAAAPHVGNIADAGMRRP